MALEIQRLPGGGLRLCANVCTTLTPADVAMLDRQARAWHGRAHVAGDLASLLGEDDVGVHWKFWRHKKKKKAQFYPDGTQVVVAIPDKFMVASGVIVNGTGGGSTIDVKRTSGGITKHKRDNVRLDTGGNFGSATRLSGMVDSDYAAGDDEEDSEDEGRPRSSAGPLWVAKKIGKGIGKGIERGTELAVSSLFPRRR